MVEEIKQRNEKLHTTDRQTYNDTRTEKKSICIRKKAIPKNTTKKNIKVQTDCNKKNVVDKKGLKQKNIKSVNPRKGEVTINKSEGNKRKIAERSTKHQKISNTSPIQKDDLLNDDVIFISSKNDENLWTEKDIQSVREYYNNKFNDYSLPTLRLQILDLRSKANDDVLDAFIGIAKESNINIEMESVAYINHPVCVYPAMTSRVAMILGGSSIDHWRLGYYDGTKASVYDAIPNYTGGKLTQKELDYVFKRFPVLSVKDIHFMPIRTRQPDGVSCGYYACGLLTFLLFGQDPSEVSLTTDAGIIRRHFLNILEQRKLSLFPLRNA